MNIFGDASRYWVIENGCARALSSRLRKERKKETGANRGTIYAGLLDFEKLDIENKL
jgi:hypothetical protein